MDTTSLAGASREKSPGSNNASQAAAVPFARACCTTSRARASSSRSTCSVERDTLRAVLRGGSAGATTGIRSLRPLGL